MGGIKAKENRVAGSPTPGPARPLEPKANAFYVSPSLAAATLRAATGSPSLSRTDVTQLQRTIGNAAVGRLLTEAAPRPNATGLPDSLKAGVEHLSGLAMDDVRVHYNSPQPAEVQALAYTQGTDIHVGPGKEKHLPHEAWHVVQQKQGRVKPTLQMKGVAINDDDALEREADAMGAEALRPTPEGASIPRLGSATASNAPIQRRVGFEFESNIGVRSTGEPLKPKTPFFEEKRWHVEPDSDHMEFVTTKLTTSAEVFAVTDDIVAWVKDLLAVPVVMPFEELNRINSRALEEKAKEQSNLDFENQLNPMDVIETIVSWGFAEEAVLEWLLQYGLLTLGKIVEVSGIKEALAKDKSLINALLDWHRNQVKVKQPAAFQEDRDNLILRDAYRPLEKMKRHPDVKGVQAMGDVQEVTAAPQATVGVTLDNLISAMHLIPKETVLTGINTPHEATRTLSDMSPQDGAILIDARQRAIRAVKPLRSQIAATEKQWRELEGVAALMVSYIRKGNAPRDHAFENAKQIAPLMSRVNFSVLFSALAPDLKARFGTALIAAAADYPADTLVFGAKGFGRNLKGPTIEQWVKSVIENKDWMSAVGGQDVVTDKQFGSPSMGEQVTLDEKDPLAPQGLVPLELRRIPKNIPLADWPMLAYQIFVLAQAMLKAKLY